MPQTRDAAVLSQMLDTRDSLSVAEAWAIFRQLLAEVGRLHQTGRVHRAIRPEAIIVEADGTVILSAAAPLIEFPGHDADREACPPEFQPRVPLSLPADTAAAAEVLRLAGISVSPERIDVYQLGVLLLRMLTGQTVDAFLRSPRVKSLIPEGFLRPITGALGFVEAERIVDVGVLAAEMADRNVCPTSSAETPPRGSAAAMPGLPASDPGDTPLPVAAAGSLRESQPPTQLGHYRILRRIGQGGMGDVYLAFEEELQRHVAIKVLPIELARNDDLMRRFLAEAAAVAQIAHPHVVPIHFIGHDAGRHFYAMQYVEGESLDRLLARQQRLPIAQTLALVEQCLSGLQAVHQAGLIHRDIKPANILMDAKTQRALVADFGLVKAGAGGPTATGVVLGTVDYMAPEIARGHKADARCDLYAVGVMAYQMLSGRLPFVAETPTAVLFQHAYEQPPPLRTVAPDVPEPVAAFVEKLMAKDAEDRYADCAAALNALRHCGAALATESFPAVKAVKPLDELLQNMELLPTSPPGPWWQRVMQSMLELVTGKRQAPWLGSATVHDVDRAVADCEARRDRIAGLLADAQSAARVLASRSPGDAPVEPGKTVAALEADADELRSQLAEADATLARLRGQRDLLKARLQAAGNSTTQPRRSGRPRQMLVAALLAAVTATALGVVLIYRLRHAEPTVASTIVPVQPPTREVPIIPPPVVEPLELPPEPVLPPPLAAGTIPTDQEAKDNRDVAMAILAVMGPIGQVDITSAIGEKVTSIKALNPDMEPFFLTRVSMNSPKVDDDTLQMFAGKKLNAVERLTLNGTKITGPGLRHVTQSMPYLRTVQFQYAPITDAGLTELAKLRELRELDLFYTKVTDGGMHVLRNFPELDYLNLHQTAVTSASFYSFDMLPKLSQFKAPPAFDDFAMPFLTEKKIKILDLSKTQVTDDGLKHLGNGKEPDKGGNHYYLLNLFLDDTHVTDAALDTIVKFPNLQSLSLNNTRVSDAGLAKLVGHKKLLQLRLNGTDITDAGLELLKELPNLSSLEMSDTNLTGDGLQHLAGLGKLSHLHLKNTKIDDSALKHLQKFKSLKYVPVNGTQVTTEGINQLKTALPKLTVDNRELPAPMTKKGPDIQK